MSEPSQPLSEQIEQLVREHIAASHRAAAAAVERAFSAACPASPRASAARAQRRTSSGRRGPVELAALAEQLYQAVCAEPGETMSVLGPKVGQPARGLHRPMAALKRTGRVRSVGKFQQMRYFPAVSRASATSA